MCHKKNEISKSEKNEASCGAGAQSVNAQLLSRLSVGSIPTRRNELFILIYISILSVWCRGKVRRWVPPLNTQCLWWWDLMESRELWCVLTLGSLCLSYCVRHAAWRSFNFYFNWRGFCPAIRQYSLVVLNKYTLFLVSTQSGNNITIRNFSKQSSCQKYSSLFPLFPIDMNRFHNKIINLPLRIVLSTWKKYTFQFLIIHFVI